MHSTGLHHQGVLLISTVCSHPQCILTVTSYMSSATCCSGELRQALPSSMCEGNGRAHAAWLRLHLVRGLRFNITLVCMRSTWP